MLIDTLNEISASWIKKRLPNFVTKFENYGHSAPALTPELRNPTVAFELIEKDQFKYILKCKNFR